MKHTFGKQLIQFALSVDVVDSNICRSVYNLVDKYFKDKLKLSHYEVMLDGTYAKDKPALRTAEVGNNFWSTRDNSDTVPIQDEEGVYKAQSTYAYANQTSLWVTAHDNRPLNDVKNVDGKWEYLDQWQNSKNLPRFFEKAKNEVRTSIVIPLKYDSRVFGFICLESNERLELSETKKNELNRIAEAIGNILWLNNSCQHRLDCSEQAFSDISQWVEQQRYLTPLSRAKVFVASSAKADSEVVGVIRSVIDEFKSELKEIYWEDIKEHGHIPLQILREISDCRFGICYFSEPHPSKRKEDGYVDNPNVLFEAGMLHALTNSPVNLPQNWIPVREEASPKIPFDFGNLRIIKIKRLDDYRLNKNNFKTDLKDSISSLCGNNHISDRND